MSFFVIQLRLTQPQDLNFVLAAESHPDNAPYVGQWSREQHLEKITQDPQGHQIILRASDQVSIGYLLLMGITDPNRSIQLKRLVIVDKGKGYGRATLEYLKQLVFERWQAHRFWLDVKDHNTKARSLYLSCGFTQEGILRECLRKGEDYESLVILSILESEYQSPTLLK